MSTIKTKVITVTPQDAERFLSTMCNNRMQRPRHITDLAAAVGRGEWGMTGQPIIFSDTGKLLDGQHRMRAVIASGVSVQFLAVYGIDESMYSKMDRCKPRSIADALVSDHNRHALAAAIKYTYVETKTKKGGFIHPGNHKPTGDEALRIKEKYPKIVDSVSEIVGKKRVLKMLGAGVAGYCLFRMRSDNELLSADFFDRLQSGDGLSAKSPILSLRNALMDKQRINGVVSDWPTPDKIAMVAKAWHMVLDRKAGAVTAASARKEWAGWRTAL